MTTPVGCPVQFFPAANVLRGTNFRVLPGLYFSPTIGGSDDGAAIIVFLGGIIRLMSGLTVSTWIAQGSNPNENRWQPVPGLGGL